MVLRPLSRAPSPGLFRPTPRRSPTSIAWSECLTNRAQPLAVAAATAIAVTGQCSEHTQAMAGGRDRVARTLVIGRRRGMAARRTFIEEFIDRTKGRCEESSLEQVRQVSHAVAHHHLIERAVYATTSLRKQRSACRFAEPPKVSERRSGAVSRCSGGCARSAAADGVAARRYWRAGSTQRSAAALRSRAA